MEFRGWWRNGKIGGLKGPQNTVPAALRLSGVAGRCSSRRTVGEELACRCWIPSNTLPLTLPILPKETSFSIVSNTRYFYFSLLLLLLVFIYFFDLIEFALASLSALVARESRQIGAKDIRSWHYARFSVFQSLEHSLSLSAKTRFRLLEAEKSRERDDRRITFVA